MTYIKCICVTSLMLLILGCGGSSSSNDDDNPSNPVVTTATGQFFDSEVSGLSFISGDQTGITGLNGEFTYELIDGVPQTVTFSIGTLVLGSTLGGAIITPFDISNSAQHEANIAALLLALDEDSNPENGIEIPETAINNYSNFDWSNVDITTSNALSSDEINLFVSDISSLTQMSLVFSDLSEIGSHLDATHRCISSGNYFGDYTGDENGPIVIGIDPLTGAIGGIGWSRDRNTGFGFPFNQNIISRLTSYEFSITANDSLEFSGKIDNYNSINGLWSSDQHGSGTFSLTKMNDEGKGITQFTGTYLADIPGTGLIPIGAFSFSVRSDSTIVGEVVNIVVGTTEISDLTGTIDGTSITIQSNNGLTFNGTIDLSTNTSSGIWSSNSGIINGGSFTANGCNIELI